MSYPERVRLATAVDKDEVIKLCQRLHEENGLMPMSNEKLSAQLEVALQKKGGFLGIIGEPGKLEGAIFLIVSTYWYSDIPHLEELFLYVIPECRRMKVAEQLMEFAKWCSDESGLPLIIGVLSTIRTKGKVRLYERVFSEPAGSFFLHKPNKFQTSMGTSAGFTQ